jgi:hypothetical protein
MNYNIKLAEKYNVRAILIEFCEERNVLSDPELRTIVTETARFFHKSVTGGEITKDVTFLISILVFPVIILTIRNVLELNGFLKEKKT